MVTRRTQLLAAAMVAVVGVTGAAYTADPPTTASSWCRVTDLATGKPATVACHFDPTTTTSTTSTTTTSTVPPTTTTVQDGDRAIWLGAEILTLPTSGKAWDELAAVARSSWGTHSLADQDNNADVRVLAGALYAVRTGDQAMHNKVRAALEAIIGTEAGARTLAVGRQLTGYVIAADLIGYRSASFMSWLSALPTTRLDGRAGITTLRGSALSDPTNWGNHARTAVLATAIYLGDAATVAQIAHAFRFWTGDPVTYRGFDGEWGDLSWQTNRNDPRGVNASSSDIRSGALPEEMRRAGSYKPGAALPRESYAWEGMQGVAATAHILARHGYPDVWTWGDSAIRRAYEFIVNACQYPAEGDDRFIDPIMQSAYGLGTAGGAVGWGKSIGFTGWSH
jgi:hypothetical protein